MSFHMNVRVDKVGERLMWTFRLLDEDGEVVGFTSMSPSTKANAYRWAEAIMGHIDPKIGWGPDDVIEGECLVVLEITEDAQGIQKNKVVKVRPAKQV